MAEQYEKKMQYEYKKISSLVLRNEPDRKRKDEPSGEGTSLAQEKLGKFGDLAVRNKLPQSFLNKGGNHKTAEILDTIKDVPIPMEIEGRHILDQPINEGQLYHPRTKDTKVLYEQFLHTIHRYIGDPSRESLLGAADEILAILKTEGLKDTERKANVESIIDKLPDETFNNLVTISRKLVDYNVEEEKRKEDDEAGNAMDIGIQLAEESASEIDEHIADSSGEDEKMEDGIAITSKIKSSEEMRDNDKKSDIDSFWLQRQLSNEFPEPQIISLENEILKALSEDNMRVCENKLLEILDYDKYDLVKKLLENKSRVYFLTILTKAQSLTEIDEIYKKMRESPEGIVILRSLEQEKTSKSSKLPFSKKNEPQQKQELDLEGIHVKEIDPMVARKNIDLSSLTFAQGAHFSSNRKCKLPKDTQTVQKKGYIERYIPAITAEIKENEKLVPILSMPEWVRPAFPPPIEKLNRIQSQIYNTALNTSENLLVCAPTGAGKTNIAMLTILQQMSLHRRKNGEIITNAFKIVYIAPMKALVAETVGNFSQRLKPYNMNVRELTGDVHLTKAEIEDTQVIITTPEKWDVVTRKSAERSFINKVKLIIIDEIHLLHDMRGPVLESLVARTIRQIESTQELVRLVALSATLPNYIDVAAFLRVKIDKGLFFFDNSYRPVPLEQIYIGITEKKAIKRLMLMNEILYEKVMERAGKQQILVFVHSRKETARTAKAIREMAIAKDELATFLKESSRSRDVLQNEANNVKSQDLKDLLQFGIGIHHAGLCRNDRNAVESLFAQRHLQILVSTATLAWGVNLPAHTVIIKGTQIYSPEQGRWVELSPQDILQMIGRAGRPFYDKTGEGIVITTSSEMQYYLSLNNMQLPIESQFLTQLPDHLNAEIVLGTVSNLRDAVTWLGYTYLYVRMLRNPELYGLENIPVEDRHLIQHRADLVHSAACILDEANLIKYDKKTGLFQITALGRVASHFYLKHDSVSIYNKNLTSNMGMIDLFRVFAMSKEFQYIIIRDEEKLELQKFAEMVPVPVKAAMEEPLAKVIILLQAYISRYRLEGYALNADMVYVSQSAGRIMRSMFEIALKRGWAQLADSALRCFKMVDRKMWSVCSPLRQFKGVPEKILRKLEQKEKFSWEHFDKMKPQELGELVSSTEAGPILYSLIHQVPKVELSAYVQPITRNCLSIELTVIPKFDWNTQIHGLAEPFWVIVEDADNELILHHEQLIIKEKYSKEEHTLNFTVLLYEPMPPQYFIKVVSDRWMNAETVLPISFRHLILPEKFPAPTSLLDLPPLKPSELEWKEVENYLFKEIKAFNAIQTQTFHALYNSDENVFVGAPCGAGKTVCAEFALLNMIKKQDTGLWLFLTPMQAVANITYNKWKIPFENILKVPVILLSGQILNDAKKLENQKGAIVIATAEQWDIISRKWKIRKAIQAISLMIVDDIHLIGESRSALEVAVSRMRYISAQIERNLRVIGLSASIANSKDIADWLGVKPPLCYNFQPVVRPIPLELHIQGFEHNERTARLYAMSKPAYQAIKQNTIKSQQCLVFCSDRKQTRLTALDFLMNAHCDYNADQFVIGEKSVCEIEASKVSEKALQHVLPYGIGYLHDGLGAEDKQVVRQLYQKQQIKILVVAHNLCWEISDLYGYMGIVLDPQRYEGHEHRYVEFSMPEMLQIMGRSGCPGRDESAKFFVFCHSPRKDYFKKFLYEPLPVESLLDLFLHDHLNAEIVSRTIESKHDSIDWLTWTFYYRRLIRNPNYYNMQGITGDHVNDKLSELIDSTIEELAAAQCIRIEKEVLLFPANLGRISAHYQTLQLFGQSLNGTLKLRGLLEVLSAASEFEGIPIRHGEEGQLSLINSKINYRLENSEKLNSPSSKTSILLQAHFGRIRISSDFFTDQRFILERSVKVIQAMIDANSSQGWLMQTILSLATSQMVVQAMWVNQSPLWQLPYFNEDLIEKCKQHKIEGITDFANLEDEERNKLFEFTPKELSEIALVCNQYPCVEIEKVTINSKSIQAGSPVEITINLNRETDSSTIPPVYAPYYPAEKEENWFLIIGEPTQNQLLAIKRISITSASVSTNLSFVVQDPGDYTLKLYLICDSYVGVDQDESFSISVSQ